MNPYLIALLVALAITAAYIAGYAGGRMDEEARQKRIAFRRRFDIARTP